jgi:arylsulfatase A-like enzyme
MKNFHITDYAGSLLRCGFVALLMFTSFYCVLAFIPDTYIAFIQAPFQTWVPFVIHLHPFIYTFLAAGVCVSLWRNRLEDRTSARMVITFVAMALCMAVYSIIARPFSLLNNNSRSFVWAMATVFQILWFGILDWRTYWRRKQWPTDIQLCISVPLVLATALTVAMVYPSAAYLRYKLAGVPPFPVHRTDLLVGVGILLAHVLFFGLVMGLLAVGEAIALRTTRRAKTRFVWFTLVAWLAVAQICNRVLFEAIPYHGIESVIYSALFGLACVIFGGSQVLGATVLPKATTETPMVSRRDRLEKTLIALVLVAAVCVVPAIIGIIDWNSILERLWALTFWVLVMILLVRILPRPRRPLPLIAALALPIICYATYRMTFESVSWSAPESQLRDAMGRQSSYNFSYVNVHDLLESSQERSCDEYCRYLHEQTNIPPGMRPAAPELDLVDRLQRTTGERPNIFVFVVDSLRQDFLTPYNPQSGYTPEIAAFARDSLVFRNAFSRYAGTTLSEPSIWAGAMLLHTHFVQPFSRVNNLEKLAVIDGYQSFITVDTVLRGPLEEHRDLVRLDQHAASRTEVDLCTTAEDAETKLSERKDPTRPIFMFSQPQNVHILTVYKRHSEQLVHTKASIEQSYSQELRRMDGCFGSFMNYLKKKELYQNSIIVLTADHGELGHGSHATSVEPDIMRVPLIIHVPEKVRRTFHYELAKLAFTTDITPSIYYLLGHRPIRTDEILGRPLITETAAELAEYGRPTYLLACSYVPNYGIIRDDGKTFFSINGNKHTEALFDLATDPHGDHDLLTARDAELYNRDIRAHVGHIANAYGFHYQPSTLRSWFLH